MATTIIITLFLTTFFTCAVFGELLRALRED